VVHSSIRFRLFGVKLEDYDSLFAEKLDLLLKIRENEHVHCSGKHRAALTGLGVYPRPVQFGVDCFLPMSDVRVRPGVFC
jgi:alkanesulfonate monooxygenase SsuD/methylene tetrahydromethanopterin reductase-like flavin-dependent oxidoreductase (luciferase family)